MTINIPKFSSFRTLSSSDKTGWYLRTDADGGSWPEVVLLANYRQSEDGKIYFPIVQGDTLETQAIAEAWQGEIDKLINEHDRIVRDLMEI